MTDFNQYYKQIDDVIDHMKKMGQYNICKQQNIINYKYPYTLETTNYRNDDTIMLFENCENNEIKQSESEITLVRVKCDGLPFKSPIKWDLHDIAIPGDGTHLGESPSMVNLATLVEQNRYLVPLSSWEPTRKRNYLVCDETEDVDEEKDKILIQRRPSLAGRISKFIRRHCKKAKTDCQLNNSPEK